MQVGNYNKCNVVVTFWGREEGVTAKGNREGSGEQAMLEVTCMWLHEMFTS